MKTLFYFLTSIILFSSCDVSEKVDKKYRFNSEIEKVACGFKHEKYAFKGDYMNALKYHSNYSKCDTLEIEFTKDQIDSINSRFKVVSAIDCIVEYSKSHQVIIINEQHHNSFHRVFAKSLLQKLFDNGYKNFGLEALTNGRIRDSELNKRKYPIRTTGYYVIEPQFGELVRTALEIGYNVFPYENTTDQDGKMREIGQARNIQNEIEKRPNEKFLIHCGYDHVMEGIIGGSWEKAMAGWLTEFTGINPLTVDQVKFSEKSDSKFNHPLLKALKINQSSILLDQENEPFSLNYDGFWTDIVVFHPNTIYENGRPSWIFENGNQSVQIELNNVSISFPIMIFAFNKNESINKAIPVDILEVENNTDSAYLALQKGEYHIVVVNEEEEVQKYELKIE